MTPDEPGELIGRIEWVAIETASGSQIAGGNKDITLADMSVEMKHSTRGHEETMAIRGEVLKEFGFEEPTTREQREDLY